MTLRQIYVAIQRSVLDYAAAAWQPNLSQTHFDKLERSHNRALRVIPGEALHIESGVSSYCTHSNRLIASSYQKATRNPPDHPRTQILYKLATNRLKRSSWRKQSEELNKIPSNSHTEPKTNSASEPAAITELQRLHVNTTVIGRIKSVTLYEVISHLDSFDCKLTIYTDGSATAGITDGGYAANFTSDSASSTEVIRIIRKRGRIITSSCDRSGKLMLVQ